MSPGESTHAHTHTHTQLRTTDYQIILRVGVIAPTLQIEKLRPWAVN